MRPGGVALVGAGPGDPQLLTLRGRSLLAQADVVVYDHLVSPRMLTWCKPQARKVYVGKEAGRHTMDQAAINRLLIRSARRGQRVVRLKGGDPLVFGRGGEEALALQAAGVSWELVPGISSAFAVAAYAGIPVTHRRVSSSVLVLTGHDDPGSGRGSIDWSAVASAGQTLVFLMSARTLPGIVKRLLQAGRDAATPSAAIEWGTYPRQRTITGPLADMPRLAREARLVAPAIFVVGPVVGLRKRLMWFERRPLFGRRVLVTRAADKAEALSLRLEALGAEVETVPLIELTAVPNLTPVRQAIKELPETDWVFFTSPEGIGWLAKHLARLGKDVRVLAGCRLAAIGRKTALALEDLGLRVDLVPAEFRQEGLLEALPRPLIAGRRGIIFCAEASRDALRAGLTAAGMRVSKVAIYRTRQPKGLGPRLRAVIERPLDAVTVTSASTVEHLHQALRASGRRAAFGRLPFVSIGPVTSAAVRRLGGRVAAEATESTVEGLVEALVRRVGRARATTNRARTHAVRAQRRTA